MDLREKIQNHFKYIFLRFRTFASFSPLRKTCPQILGFFTASLRGAVQKKITFLADMSVKGGGGGNPIKMLGMF